MWRDEPDCREMKCNKDRSDMMVARSFILPGPYYWEWWGFVI